MRLVIAITGASGVAYGRRLLEELGKRGVETHLVVSKAAARVIEHELGHSKEGIEALATCAYDEDELDAPMMSGSFKTNGMIIIPCSMKTLAGIAQGYADNLILRAADVTLKERRSLVIVPRETPLSAIHLRNMLVLARSGVVIVPAMPAFYHKPKGIDDLVDYVVGKVLDVIGLEQTLFRGWGDNT